jgi:hypothetical protein
MPQATFTNSYEMGDWDIGDGFYWEQWVNYRDIFGKEWIVGEGGVYDFTNNIWTPEGIKWTDFYHPNMAIREKNKPK